MDIYDLEINIWENSYYNFIVVLYIGFLFIYVSAPNPTVLYKRILQKDD